MHVYSLKIWLIQRVPAVIPKALATMRQMMKLRDWLITLQLWVSHQICSHFKVTSLSVSDNIY